MGNLLYLISAILVITWSILFLGYNIGGFFHVLLVTGILLFMFRVLNTNRIGRQ